MASVTSLDQDMRRLRMERVTPRAEEEVRAFIQASLKPDQVYPGKINEHQKIQDREIDNRLLVRLGQEGLFNFMGDGVALCRLAERATANVHLARENVSLFLAACNSDPINLHSHDTFLTIDLTESKDLAQVLQCLGAFSRAAHRLQPSSFPIQVGGKARGGVMSPQGTGTPKAGGVGLTGRPRGTSNTSNTSSTYTYSGAPDSVTLNMTVDLSSSGRWSPTKSTSGVTPPPWNEFQYGSLRGANQGNLGVSFGAPRQITSASPHVPSLAEKEKARRQKQEEEERLRREEQKVEEERVRAEEEIARVEEERKWAEEAAKTREREQLRIEEEKRMWEEEDRRWKLEEERREKEEREAEARLEEERRRVRGKSDARLQGQFLSQYQAENSREAENSRIKELERELELAREREREYERERQTRSNVRSYQTAEDQSVPVRRKEEAIKARSRSRSRPRAPSSKNSDDNWRQDEREYLRQQWSANQHNGDQGTSPPSKSPRPLPEPTPPVRVKTNHTGPSSRPLPDPANYISPKEPPRALQSVQNRTDRYLASNPAPQQSQPRTTYSNEIGAFDGVAERDAEDQRRLASQSKTKAGGWASMSLLEREMETERQRQQEWEQNLKENQTKRGLVGPRPPPR
ncbi:hypothetical protein OIDMADRAFT_143228 [Oidiodendron maius Zn]|uniref:Calponin-homology (CH) domain-containing protein n=1 Tax=Oidiodendron maius (strain Zn) TaxID=913774 RepID=A0A0C3CXI7_OIDMZ|nr:hypothetical protein OIDMADRAFT_143228 [Oidiodendron maius Zn]